MQWLNKYRTLLFLMLLVVASNWFMMSRERVERIYAEGVYPPVSSLMRFVFGHLPFSLGDLLYVMVILLLIFQLILFFRSVFSESHRMSIIARGVRRGIQAFAVVWLLFHGMWGFNYYRLSIPDRFGLSREKVSDLELVDFAKYSLAETNKYASGRKLDHHLTDQESVFLAYDSLSKQYPSLQLNNHSHKASMFGVLGNYMGYGGYYNPFTGEAQVNDKMPSFLLPFISLHELAHQLGNSSILYSANLELFMYATSALKRKDSVVVDKLIDGLSPIAKNDIRVYEEFIKRYYGPLDRFISKFYSGFLRFNNQPEGMFSYNKGMFYVMRYLQKKGRIPQPF